MKETFSERLHSKVIHSENNSVEAKEPFFESRTVIFIQRNVFQCKQIFIHMKENFFG